MKLCRFTLKADSAAAPRLGIFEDGGVRDVTGATAELPQLAWPLPRGDQLIANLPGLKPRLEALAQAAPLIGREEVRLLSPVANPGKIICGAANWRQHGVPLGHFGFLFKVTSALAGEGEGVEIRWPDRATLYEPELGLVIGRECRNIDPREALAYVAGYTCALDMTMKEDNEFYSFCKAFDTFGVLGPCLVTADEIPDPSELAYEFRVDGELRGNRSFKDLTASPAELVAYASSVMTLEPGDVILSGAADVGPVAPGEVMVLDIPRIGCMTVPVSISPHRRGGAAG